MSVETAQLQVSDKLLRGLLIAAGVGALIFVIGLFVASQRAWGGYLMGYVYFVQLALAGPVFLSFLYLAGARWQNPLQRVPEAMAGALPVAAVLGLVLILGAHSLYEWTHAEHVEGDALLEGKASYLNMVGFSLRLVIYFALWIWLGRKVVQRSRTAETGAALRRGNIKAATLFLAAFALTFSLACVDWIMSLEPHWFSTMFALRILSGLGCAGLAASVLALLALRRSGHLKSALSPDLLDDLGKLMLALSFFWAYIWYCQYLIIWYMDMPEETGYFFLRKSGGWAPLMPLNLVVNAAVPFLIMLLRSARRNPLILTAVSLWMLGGHALDLFILVEPSLMRDGPSYGLWELGPLVGLLALFCWAFLRSLASVPLRPQGTS